MKKEKMITSLVAFTFTCIFLPVQAFPQFLNIENDIFAVDGFAFDGPAEGLDPITFERTTKMPVTSAPTGTTSMSIDRCVNVCPITSEYNPVCGTDRVVYSNPGHLGCARRCGRAINLANYGPCSTGTARG